MRYTLHGFYLHCKNIGVTQKEVIEYTKIGRSTFIKLFNNHDTDAIDKMYEAAEAVRSLKD